MPRGRPPKPIDANASAAARLGAQLRGSHVAHDLTLAGIEERAVIVWGTEHPWPAARRSVMRSYCAMHGAAAGDAAREEALRLYADADWRGPAQIKLHRAASEADPHDAVATLSDLGEAQRGDRFVRMIAVRAVAACEAREVAGVAALREVLVAEGRGTGP